MIILVRKRKIYKDFFLRYIMELKLRGYDKYNKDRLIEGKWCQMIYFFNLTEEELK